jgi:putative colanic acid biosynthesis acetyltransferase WcaF
MGEHSCLGAFVDCYSVDQIILGPHATISQYSFLCAASRDYRAAHLPLLTAPITIGPHVWVGADVFVGPGVSIGEGAVVGARSTVLSDIPAGVIAAGNPARQIKNRMY